jgi:hypothetical protein
MPKLVCNRDFTLTTTRGHIIRFKKGVVADVPYDVYKQALSIGAQPPEGEEVVIEDEGDKDAEKAPTSPDERLDAFRSAVDKMRDRNRRGDFAATGAPKSAPVSELAGFNIPQKEANAMWDKLCEAGYLNEHS